MLPNDHDLPVHKILEYQTTEEDWDNVMNINLKSHAFLTNEVVPHMTTKGKGSIVYIASIAGYIPMAGIYSISKTALISMTKAFAVECSVHNIRVNCVAPGLIKTEMSRVVWEDEKLLAPITNMSPMKRMGVSDEISGVVAFLCSEDAAYITGETIVVAGGTNCRM